MKSTEKTPIAVLIDADNVESGQFKHIFREISNHGDPVIKRIYGDWSNQNLKGWDDVFKEFALTQVQVSQNTNYKNSTDISLVIEAMDILNKKDIDGFCIVSSDSDYTKLSMRIREENKFVIGIGHHNKVSKVFVNSCNQFIYYDNLLAKFENTTVNLDTKELRNNKELMRIINSALEDLDIEDNKLNIGFLKNKILKLFPDFDSNMYGYKKFTDLLENIGYWKLIDNNKTMIIESIITENNTLKGKISLLNGKFQLIDDITNKSYDFNPSNEKNINISLLEIGDFVTYTIKNKVASDLKLYGEIISMGKYGFISGSNGDVFIPDSEVPKLKKENIKYSDLVTYYKSPPSNNGKNTIASNISKL